MLLQDNVATNVWKRVDKFLTDLDVAKVCNGDFIPDYVMYPLIGKAIQYDSHKIVIKVQEQIYIKSTFYSDIQF